MDQQRRTALALLVSALALWFYMERRSNCNKGLDSKDRSRLQGPGTVAEEGGRDTSSTVRVRRKGEESKSGRDPFGKYAVAIMNLALLKETSDAPSNDEFMQSLEPVMMMAERQAGFVWRFRSKIHGPTDRVYNEMSDKYPGRAFINLSCWESIDDLRHFMFKSGHAPYFSRRKEWFEDHCGFELEEDQDKAPHSVCWWLPKGSEPTFEQGLERYNKLLRQGSSEDAFYFKAPVACPYT